jgi:endonuclease III
MGYKKLDEVMELLTDELDGFNASIKSLKMLTKNVEDIRILPDTSEIERTLLEHLNMQRKKDKEIQESIHNIGNHISKARLIPKVQLALFNLDYFFGNHRLSGF